MKERNEIKNRVVCTFVAGNFPCGAPTRRNTAIPRFSEKKLEGLHIGPNFGINSVQAFPKGVGLSARLWSHTYKYRYAQNIQVCDVPHLADASS